MAGDRSTSPKLTADETTIAAHMNLLQDIISRLANNSASCKTWCLTLITALVGLAGATHVSGIMTFSIVPVLIFGFMDVLYLANEKAYRDLYNSVVNLISTDDYRLADAYDAAAKLELRHIGSATISWSIAPVYLGLIIAYSIASANGWFDLLTVVTK